MVMMQRKGEIMFVSYPVPVQPGLKVSFSQLFFVTVI